jgi:glucose-6-phosphate dehydrogenase assembly protein OpcA
VTSGKVSDAIAAVEAQLAAAWAPPDAASGAVAKVRASMMNLAIATTAADLPRWRAATDDLAQTHPGRAFLLSVGPRLAPWEVEADATAVCRVGEGGGAPICSDRIELSLGAMAAARAPSLVAALALSDIPMIVEIAQGAPTALALGLVRDASRVVVDSAGTSLGRLAEIARATRAPLADRAWVRTFTWRELTARFFDDAPSALATVRRVGVARTDGLHDPAPLFVAWLASRLGWRLVAPDRAEAAGRAIEIALVTDERADAGESALTAVRLWTEIDGAEAELSCERTASPTVLCWRVRGPREREREHALGFRDETWVAGKALDATEGDRVYREALLAASGWASLRAAEVGA